MSLKANCRKEEKNKRCKLQNIHTKVYKEVLGIILGMIPLHHILFHNSTISEGFSGLLYLQ